MAEKELQTDGKVATEPPAETDREQSAPETEHAAEISTSEGPAPKTMPKSTSTAKTTANDEMDDIGIVIVDDTIEVNREKINEERKAYLEEARSQEAFD